MTFSDPRWLWLVAVVPVLLLLEWAAARRRDHALRTLVGARAPHALLAQRLPGEWRAGMALRALAIAALAVGAAGPEWGHELVRRSASGSDVVFGFDVSASMDARDVAPSRLDEARREALALLERLGGSRVGVVVFAGDAVRLCPLTLDRGAVRLVLESLSSGSVSTPGTDLGRGLSAAARMLPGGRRSEQAIVVWTDGEDLERGAAEATEPLVTAGQRVFAVGVGTPAGDMVPVLDEQGRAVDVKRDDNGVAVRSRLDEAGLRAIARRTRGAYFSAARPGGETARLLTSIGRLGRGDRGERLVERPVPRFAWFGALAALALGLDLVRRRRRDAAKGGPTRASRRTGGTAAPRAGRAAAVVLAVLAMLAFGGRAEAQSAWARGDAAFRKGQWAAAESLYAIRARRDTPAELMVNLATARARAGKPAEAEQQLAKQQAATGRTGQTASYNLGTLRAERGDTDGALEALRRALERDPNDADARHNYEWTLLHRRRPPDGGQRPQPKPEPQPQPEPQPAQSQGNGNPPPTPPGAQPPPQQQAPPRPQSPSPGRGMTREQAERILGSLQELERREQQRMRQVRVMRERRGKDW